ncbi:copper amine oxidase N-terminal domain-containing protein [Anaerotignum sp.]
MKRILSMLTAVLMATGMTTTAFAAELSVTVDGSYVAWTDAKPFIDENDRTLVPLRPIANALGLEVSWDDDKNTASFTDGETTAEFVVGANEYHAFLNNYDFHVYVKMDTTPIIKDSRIYAPARYLAECFHYVVGWSQAAQEVVITKETAPDEEIIVEPALPIIAEGEKAAAEPMVTSPGITAVSNIALNGMVEDPDIFAYEAVMDCPVDSNENGLLMEDGYLVFDLQPAMDVAPGTYTVTWTLPGGWFEDGEDVIVTVPLTVTKTTVLSAMTAAVDDLGRTNFYVAEDATAEEINAKIMEDFWLFHNTSFALEISEGTLVQDEYGDQFWEFIITVTDTETGENLSCTAKCGLEYESYDW